jgi:hypothetical protein
MGNCSASERTVGLALIEEAVEAEKMDEEVNAE